MISILSNFAHKSEMRESQDEMLVGEIVRAMARQGAVTTQFMGMAAMYQTTRMTRQMTATGSALPGSRAKGFAAMAGAALTQSS